MIEFGNIAHGEQIAKAIPRRFNPACDPVISVVGAGGKLLGGVIYDGYTGSCIFIHQAGFDKHWMNRDLLWAAFDYPFNQLGCSRVRGTIPSTDEQLLAINLRLGFIVEASLEDGYPGGNMLILSMKRDKCPWLKIKPRTVQAGVTGAK